MTADEQPTCGKGLAENSILPDRVGELISAMAKNLEVHMRALDRTDENSRAEYDAYESLLKQLQQAAHQLQDAAQEMAGYRDLPMGRHDEKEMTHPEVRETFEQFVQRKRELLSVLEGTVARDQQLLEMMRTTSR